MEPLSVLGQPPTPRAVGRRLHSVDLRSVGRDEGHPAHLVLTAFEIVIAHDLAAELPRIEGTKNLGPVLDRSIEILDHQADMRHRPARHATSLPIAARIINRSIGCDYRLTPTQWLVYG